MATMHVMANSSAAFGIRAQHPVRRAHRAPRVRAASPVARHPLMAQAADATMRFTLALVPFSALVWMFVAH